MKMNKTDIEYIQCPQCYEDALDTEDLEWHTDKNGMIECEKCKCIFTPPDQNCHES